MSANALHTKSDSLPFLNDIFLYLVFRFLFGFALYYGAEVFAAQIFSYFNTEEDDKGNKGDQDKGEVSAGVFKKAKSAPASGILKRYLPIIFSGLTNTVSFAPVFIP